MCGRYASYLPTEALRRLFGTANPLPNIKPSWNVTPTQSAPVVHLDADTGERHLDPMAWGLLPSWMSKPRSAPRPTHVQAETVIQMGMLQGAMAQWRCIAPAGAYYERQIRKHEIQHYAVARRDRLPMAFAGLWTTCRLPNDTALYSFVIITTAATQDVAALHPRMPVILEPADWPVWFGEVEGDPTSLLHPSAVGTLRIWPVNRPVENPQDNRPEPLEPIVDVGLG